MRMQVVVKIIKYNTGQYNDFNLYMFKIASTDVINMVFLQYIRDILVNMQVYTSYLTEITIYLWYIKIYSFYTYGYGDIVDFCGFPSENPQFYSTIYPEYISIHKYIVKYFTFRYKSKNSGDFMGTNSVAQWWTVWRLLGLLHSNNLLGGKCIFLHSFCVRQFGLVVSLDTSLEL